MEAPEDVWTWLVGGTCVDVKMQLASLIADGADLDLDDVDQVIREVIVDALFDGLTRRQMLLGLVLSEEPIGLQRIDPHFIDAFAPALESVHPLSVSPVKLHPEPGRAIGSVCQRLFEAVKAELELLCILATDRSAFYKRYIEP